MRKTMLLNNVILRESEEGYWLSVKASNRKQAAILLNGLASGIIKDAFVQWAEDNLKK